MMMMHFLFNKYEHSPDVLSAGYTCTLKDALTVIKNKFSVRMMKQTRFQEPFITNDRGGPEESQDVRDENM